jgi:hypothetical protein
MRGWVEKLKGKGVAVVLIALVIVTSLAGMWEKLELSIYDKEYKTNIIISDRALKYLKHREKLPGEITLLGETSVRGMVEKVLIYTVKTEKPGEG